RLSRVWTMPAKWSKRPQSLARRMEPSKSWNGSEKIAATIGKGPDVSGLHPNHRFRQHIGTLKRRQYGESDILAIYPFGALPERLPRCSARAKRCGWRRS